jgi:Zn-dependent metalloprotease
MCKQRHRHSIFCILPPHMLDKVMRNGSADQREWALNNMQVNQTMHSFRVGEMLQAPKAMGGGTPGLAQRTIYTADSGMELPGKLVRSEGDGPTDDVSTNEAYDGLGATYDFFWQIFQRNSIDDEGMPLTATVHFGKRFDNAFWTGAQMIFGDGDGQLFKRFTISLDVIGHELTHGVTQDEAGLVYMNQSGALNESLSDVFGLLVKQYALKQDVTQADWLIGAALLTDKVQGRALRSMSAPGTAYDDPMLGKDPQPGHTKDFVRTMADNGGVHINSGIPNRAFYLTASAIGGNAWAQAGHIWYDTVRDKRLKKNAGFSAFAKLTLANAVSAYGPTSLEAKAVREAWNTVGVKL